jgi:hypothetical protein
MKEPGKPVELHGKWPAYPLDKKIKYRLADEGDRV